MGCGHRRMYSTVSEEMGADSSLRWSETGIPEGYRTLLIRQSRRPGTRPFQPPVLLPSIPLLAATSSSTWSASSATGSSKTWSRQSRSSAPLRSTSKRYAPCHGLHPPRQKSFSPTHTSPPAPLHPHLPTPPPPRSPRAASSSATGGRSRRSPRATGTPRRRPRPPRSTTPAQRPSCSRLTRVCCARWTTRVAWPSASSAILARLQPPSSCTRINYLAFYCFAPEPRTTTSRPRPLVSALLPQPRPHAAACYHSASRKIQKLVQYTTKPPREQPRP